MTEKPIATIFDFSPLKINKNKHSEYEKNNPIKEPMPLVDPHALVGIEIEVERMYNMCEVAYYWNKKEDNSLRDCGLEFTSIPLRAEQVEYALNVYNQTVLHNNNPSYSNRTSVHVHLNVRDLSWNQIQNLVILYCLFEKHFFHLAGTKRESSIFCVPLYKTIPDGKLSNLQNSLNNWHKYNALNLSTILGTNGLPMYGTVEFRHLYGTGDTKTIIDWINNILVLRKEALNWTTENLLEKIKTLNTTSEYVHMYKQIFGEYCLESKMLKHDFESCVTFVKTWEWGNDLNNKYKCAQNSPYFTKYKPQIKAKAYFDVVDEILQKKLDEPVAVEAGWCYQNTNIAVPEFKGKDLENKVTNGTYGVYNKNIGELYVFIDKTADINAALEPHIVEGKNLYVDGYYEGPNNTLVFIRTNDNSYYLRISELLKRVACVYKKTTTQEQFTVPPQWNNTLTGGLGQAGITAAQTNAMKKIDLTKWQANFDTAKKLIMNDILNDPVVKKVKKTPPKPKGPAGKVKPVKKINPPIEW